MGGDKDPGARFMKLSWQVLPGAEKDISQAYQWYEESRPGLGEDFLLCFEAALSAIQDNPQIFPAVHKDVRRALLRRFPYAVFYMIHSDTIVILAVFHCARDPESWRTRRRGKANAG